MIFHGVMVLGNAYDLFMVVVGNAYDFFMAVCNAYDFSWWLATCMIFMVVGKAYDFSWRLVTQMIFHGGWQRRV